MNSHHRHLCSCPVYRRDPYWVHCCSPSTFNPLATLYESMACSTTNTPMTYCHFALTKQALAEAVHHIEKCVDELKDWMTANLLSMNDSKTQYMPIVPKSAAWLLDEVDVTRIGDDTVTAATTVRNLGVHFDHHLDMNSQISHVISACSYHPRNINVVPELTNTTPLLRKLHWLPVARRIQYKILLLSYKITHRHAPFYLRDLLPSYQPTRCLRSSSSNALVVPRTRGKAGDAVFSVAAPQTVECIDPSIEMRRQHQHLKK